MYITPKPHRALTHAYYIQTAWIEKRNEILYTDADKRT